MNYIIFDLEWNQSPRGKEQSVSGVPFEIIEFGAIRLNEKHKETGRFHAFVKPKLYKELHFVTKQIVHVTSKELEAKGRPFPEVMKEFLDFCGEDFTFCTWGTSDLTELQKNMNYYNMGNIHPLFQKPIYYYDIQKLFSIQFEDGKERKTLQAAIEFFPLKESMEFHSALNDAAYTAAVFKKLHFEKVHAFYSIDTYRIPEKGEEIYANFGTYEKYISHGFTDRDTVLSDRNVSAVECFLCPNQRRLRKKLHWFSSNGKTYHSVGICPVHGLIKSKLRIKQTDDGLYYVIKTTKRTNEEKLTELRARQKHVQEKKRLKRLKESKNNKNPDAT